MQANRDGAVGAEAGPGAGAAVDGAARATSGDRGQKSKVCAPIRALLKHSQGWGEAGLGLENRGWLAPPEHPPPQGGTGWAGLGWEGKSHGTLQKIFPAFVRGEAGTYSGTPPRWDCTGR
jgi:hypothetical protein